MINYRTHVTIKIGHKVVEEYFDIMNIEHYDAILGTPFLRKMGIVLDFRSPGIAWCHDSFVLVDSHSIFIHYFPSLHSLVAQASYPIIHINL